LNDIFSSWTANTLVFLGNAALKRTPPPDYAVTHRPPHFQHFALSCSPFSDSLVTMRPSALPWRLAAAAVLWSQAFLLPFTQAASPSIDVALETSFSAAPYLVELLYVEDMAHAWNS
jgi:hypothetical protein